jgi:hypothetical protein
LIFVHLPAQHSAKQIIDYHKSFDKDIPVVADMIRKKLSESNSSKLRILISDRRRRQYDYWLFEDRSKLKFVAFRELYYAKTDLKKEKIDYVLYAPDDLYPLQSAFNAFDLLSEDGLKRQGLRIEGKTWISEHTSLLRIAPLIEGQTETAKEQLVE